MEKKVRILFEILFVVGAIIYYVVTILIPDIKENMGSSDSLISVKDYQNMVEIEIDSKIDFAMVINDQKEVYHLLFFHPNDYPLYNQNIEKETIPSSIHKSFEILNEYHYLTKDSKALVTRYGEKYYSEFIEEFKKELSIYSISPIMEKESSLEEKVKALKIQENSLHPLRQLDFYSKDLMSSSQPIEESHGKNLTEDVALTLSQTVYKKIENQILMKSITAMSKEESKMVVPLIPADEDGKYYPTVNSWFYVENGKVYAYIEFQELDNSYGFCYKGSLDLMQKGVCL